jgi:outer membrane receptor protein involved in Fe transport
MRQTLRDKKVTGGTITAITIDLNVAPQEKWCIFPLRRKDGGSCMIVSRASGISATVAALLGSTALIASPASAQTVADTAAPDEIVVTAQRREQLLQDVPISIQALGEARLEQAQVQNFDDYAKLLPSVSYQSFGPGQSQIFFRGVSSGGDGLHIGPLPTTGLYIDEIPMTTIYGSVDFHVYDIARVEALAGSQGTLFGASSLSGTLRIITNKPDTGEFSGSVDAEVNKYGEGDWGGQLEGHVNLPISENAALRLVGYYSKMGGYIDNIPGTRTFTLDDNDPTTNLTVNNNALVEDDYNDVETYGGRAALAIDLDDNWTVTPQIIYQHLLSHGGFLYDPRKGDLKVTDYLPSRNKDRWYQAALTVTGKLSNWDIVYSGGYFERKVDNLQDYSYYSVAYDTYGYYATFFRDADTGAFLDPTEVQIFKDKYTKLTQELRVSSPSENSFRLTAGLFYQRQTDRDHADFNINGISNAEESVWINPFPGFGDTIFMRRILRVDRDYAAFGQAEFDVSPTITLTAGLRGFIAKNTLFGFSGLLANVDDTDDDDNPLCLPTQRTDRPCNNVDKKNDESGVTYKFGASWKITPDAMVYATLSKGFRPGGNNRRVGVDPYKSDTLTNYEVGAKTSFGPFTVNAAAFYQKWKDVQFGLVPLGQNGVTNTYNAGDARIYGAEGDIAFRSGGLSVLMAGTYINAKLSTDLCQVDEVTKNIVCVPGVPPAAPRGTRLPVQPKFKGNATVRYSFVQGAVQHQGGTRSFLTDADFAAVGPTKGFTSFDFSVGGKFDRWRVEAYIQNAFDKRGQLSLNTVCATTFCGPFARVYPIKPQLFGLKVGTDF